MHSHEDPKDYDWLDAVYKRCVTDPTAVECRKEMQKCAPAFQEIRESLSQEQRDTLDDYICACENYERAHTIVAYQLGREHGQIVIIPPKSD